MTKQRRLRTTGTSGRVGLRVAIATVVLVGFGAFPGSAQSNDTSSTTADTSSSTSEQATTSTAGDASTTSSSDAAPSSTDTTTQGGATSTTVDAATAEELQRERERLEAAEAAKAREVNAANATLDDVTSALKVLQDRVDAQSGRVEYASQRLADAEASVVASTEEVATAEAEIDELQTRLTDQAIRTFMGDEGDQVVLANVPDPSEALRRQTLLAQVTQTDIDLVGALQAAQEDLSVRRAEALDAVEAANALSAEAQEQLETLEADQAAQGRATAAAEQRLDHLLAERAALAALGEEAANGLPAEDELVEQLAAAPTPAPANPAPSPAPPSVGEADIAYAGNGIHVHVSIVDNVRRLLADAAAAGVDLAGGGYRSSAAQIRTRRNNCGTSNYAIYEMPASQCRPPTARPGRSMHEQGKAIDFTYNGSLIRSRSGGGWIWLRDNAAAYGLQNLPVEPWHWSVNGN